MASVLLMYTLFGATVADTAINFKSRPSEITPGFTDQLTFTCLLNDTSTTGIPNLVGRDLSPHSRELTSAHVTHDTEDIGEVTTTSEVIDYVTTIVMSHSNGDVMASVNERRPPTLYTQLPDAQVTGNVSVSAGGLRGYLEVVIRHPNDQLTGDFQCRITAITMKGQSLLFSSSVTIGTADPTIPELILLLNQIDNEKKVLVQKNEILRKQIMGLNHTASELNETVRLLTVNATEKTLEINTIKYNLTQNINIVSDLDLKLSNNINIASKNLKNAISKINAMDSSISQNLNTVSNNLNNTINHIHQIENKLNHSFIAVEGRLTQSITATSQNIHQMEDRLKHTETGSFHCENQSFHNGGTYTRYSIMTHAFSQHYDTPPTVLLSVTRVDGAYPRADTFHYARAITVNTTHFKTQCAAYDSSQIKTLFIEWISFAKFN